MSWFKRRKPKRRFSESAKRYHFWLQEGAFGNEGGTAYIRRERRHRKRVFKKFGY